jgi:hypothetical protein
VVVNNNKNLYVKQLHGICVILNTIQHLLRHCVLSVHPQGLNSYFVAVKLVPLKGIPAVVKSRLLFIYLWFIDKAVSITEIALNSRMINE